MKSTTVVPGTFSCGHTCRRCLCKLVHIDIDGDVVLLAALALVCLALVCRGLKSLARGVAGVLGAVLMLRLHLEYHEFDVARQERARQVRAARQDRASLVRYREQKQKQRESAAGDRSTNHRVACAVVGETRTLADTVESLILNVLEPLDADVFLHLSHTMEAAGGVWNKKAIYERESRIGNMSIPPPRWPPEKDVARFMDALQPVRSIVEEGVHLFTRWQLAYKVIVAYEAVGGFTYAWIIRTRPDLLYRCALSRGWLDALGRFPALYWDFVLVVPRQYANVAFVHARSGFECQVRTELCVPSALASLANVSYYHMAPSPTIHRWGRCPENVTRLSWLCHHDADARTYNSMGPICRMPNGNRPPEDALLGALRYWSKQNADCRCSNGTNVCLEQRHFCAQHRTR